MRKEKISEIISDINSEYIEEAEESKDAPAGSES